LGLEHGDVIFGRLDRGRDGSIKADDLDWSDRSAYARQAMPARHWFGMFDGNSNGRITREEWEALFKRAAKGKDFLTADDLREAFPTSPPPRQPGEKPPQGPPKEMLLRGLLAGELGSFREGPPLGADAPDFTLRTHDDKQSIALSQYRGKKPVVLIFGSFT
jgi:hypothetical protein